jgi:hypothetical protein
MKRDQDKMYARLETCYRDLLIPIDLMDQILRDARLVKTEYRDSSLQLTEIEHIRKAEFHTQKEVDFTLAQQKLENAS